MRENEAMAVLVSAKEISYGQRERALAEAGSALALLADPHAFEQTLGMQGISAIRAAMKNADRMLDRLFESGTHLIARGMEEYPQRLLHTAKPPHLLFCQGSANLDDAFQLSIVGTRRADSYGLRHTRRIARELAHSGMCIVSGLALGIDSAAHCGALDAKGRTVAVLGGAIDKLYPAENRTLMQQILDGGGSVVSEYPPGVAPTRYSFIQRNRIVAGMSLGVLVTQAPMKSGALSTAHYALDEGREVFALPGDIDRMGSQLPNRLIAEGARPVTCAQEITQLLVIEPRRKRENTQSAPRQNKQIEMKSAAPSRRLDAQEQKVYDQLLASDQDFDALCERTGIPSDELSGVLMMLEMDGIVVALPGLAYRLV